MMHIFYCPRSTWPTKIWQSVASSLWRVALKIMMTLEFSTWNLRVRSWMSPGSRIPSEMSLWERLVKLRPQSLSLISLTTFSAPIMPKWWTRATHTWWKRNFASSSSEDNINANTKDTNCSLDGLITASHPSRLTKLISNLILFTLRFSLNWRMQSKDTNDWKEWIIFRLLIVLSRSPVAATRIFMEEWGLRSLLWEQMIWMSTWDLSHMRSRSQEKPIGSSSESSGLLTATDLSFTNIILKLSKRCEMHLSMSRESTLRRSKEKETN